MSLERQPGLPRQALALWTLPGKSRQGSGPAGMRFARGDPQEAGPLAVPMAPSHGYRYALKRKQQGQQA